MSCDGAVEHMFSRTTGSTTDITPIMCSLTGYFNCNMMFANQKKSMSGHTGKLKGKQVNLK